MERKADEDVIHPVLLAYLEANTYREKLAVIEEHADMTWDNHLISSMAMSVDIAIDGEAPDDRLEQLKDCLRIMGRFENNRFR